MKISNFPGNLYWKIPLKVEGRKFSIPWLQKTFVISFAKDRTFSSSLPVRYIPKKSSKTEELHHSSPVKELEEKETNNRANSIDIRFEKSDGARNVRRSIHLNKNFQNEKPINNFTFDGADIDFKEQSSDGLGVMDFEFMEEPEDVSEELKIDEADNSHEWNVPQDGKTKEDAEKFGIELLATRAFTAVELRKKLQGKRFPHDAIDAVVIDFQSRGLINDSLYAETFSRSRWSSSSWGPRRIKQALVKKGISEGTAEKAVKLVFQDGKSGEEEESGLGLSKLSMDHLFVQASKQWLRGRDVPRETQKSRIIRWLQYRGFNWDVISFMLKKLESQYPA